MGSHASPVMANIIMEIYKETIVCTAKLPPRYLDDIIKKTEMKFI